MVEIELNANAETLVPGRILHTRNGRRQGNAIVIGKGIKPDLYKIKTDFGNATDNISAREIASIFTLGDVTDLERWQGDRIQLMYHGFSEDPAHG